jgi:WD40 repeat-containing protein SMU1
MKHGTPEKYERLEQLCSRAMVDVRDLYEGSSKDKRRAGIAHSLSQEVTMVPPSRLLAVIGQALKW